MDFFDIDHLADAREAAARWVDENADPAWAEEQARTGDFHTPELQKRLARDGWLGAGWPPEYGGTENSPELATAIVQEMARRGFHLDGWGSTRLVCRTLLHVGTEDQKRRYVGGMIRGEVLIALGYTEPDSGSDAAAAKCRSVRDGDEWVIDGQKTFTSTAQLATHVFLLTRSNVEARKHEGLTMFMVPLDAPGIDIQPMLTLGGQRTNSTYYTGVRVPDGDRVGDVGGGWGVMRLALGFEHGAAPPQIPPTLLERVAAWARRTRRPDGTSVFDDPSVRERLVRAAIDEEMARLLSLRVAWVVETGGVPSIEGSMAKLFGAEARQRQHTVLQDVIGAEAVLHRFSGEAPLDGAADEAFRYGVVGTIYGGSSEIMREIIAQRGLGLPRNRPVP